MPELGPAEKFSLEAASGWLMLGNVAEADREWQQLSPAGRASAEGLLVLWDIQAHRKEWESAVRTADQILALDDRRPEGYIKRAYALHELKETQLAWDTLQAASNHFNDNWLIPYNLACYACQMGRANEAMVLFRRALKLGDKKELRSMALEDPDLEPIRGEIEKLA